MPADLTDLLAQHREVAEAATKGPWSFRVREIFGFGKKRWVAPIQREPEFTATGFQSDDNSAHIAINDPDVALALNTVAQAYESYLRQVEADYGPLDGADLATERPGKWDALDIAGYAALAHLHEVLQAKMGDEG